MTALERVAIDGRSLQEKPRAGVGRALAGVLSGIAEHHDVDLLLRAGGGATDMAVGAEHMLTAPSRRWSIWLETAVPRFLRGYPGIFHCPWYGLPRRQPVPMVVTIHDISYERHPEWFPPSRRVAYRSQARHAARTARAILAPSEFAADEVAEFYGRDRVDILVAPHAVEDRFRPRSPDDLAPVVKRFGLPSEYLVALGGRARRRPEVALEVARRLQEQGHGLPVVMLDAPDAPPESGVIRLSKLDDHEFAQVMAGGSLFVYPTVYEGFGLPALEAIACGTPVVASRVASLPQVLGPAAAWATDTSVNALVEAADRILRDSRAIAELVAAGLERAAEQRDWRPSVSTHLEAYDRACQR